MTIGSLTVIFFVYYPVLDMAYELSSMGTELTKIHFSQIKIAGCEDRLELDFA